MCVIIHRPANVKIPNRVLTDCMIENPHGWGLMWIEQGRLKTLKGADPRTFDSAYATVPDNVEVAIHFRWKTHGKIDDANAHPYPVLNKEQHGFDLALMHNGVLDVPVTRPEMSDTWHWIEEYIRPLLENDIEYYDHEEFWEFVEQDSIGSRLLFMDETGHVTRTGKWHAKHGCHFSNLHFEWGPGILHGTAGGHSLVPAGGKRILSQPGIDDPNRYYDPDDDVVLQEREFEPAHSMDLTIHQLIGKSYGDLIEICEENPEGVANLLWDIIYNS